MRITLDTREAHGGVSGPFHVTLTNGMSCLQLRPPHPTVDSFPLCCRRRSLTAVHRVRTAGHFRASQNGNSYIQLVVYSTWRLFGTFCFRLHFHSFVLPSSPIFPGVPPSFSKFDEIPIVSTLIRELGKYMLGGNGPHVYSG